MSVSVVYESETKKLGQLIANKLVDQDYVVELKLFDKFPVADAIDPFLVQLSNNYEFAIVVISDYGESSHSVSKELSIQKHSLGKFTNIYPAFPNSFNISKWWLDDTEQIVIIDKPLPNFI